MITVLCVGTGTEVGKTWVGAAVLDRLRRRGLVVNARKVVQSFEPSDGQPTDAEVLAAATGELVEDVCPRHLWFGAAMAPPIAAAHLGQHLGLLLDLFAAMADPDEDADLVWVETVGGVRSPIAEDGDSADLARWVSPGFVVLVADAGLGTINAVRLSAIPFAGRQLLVVLNRYDDRDPIHVANAEWLRDDGFSVSTSAEQLAGFLEDIVAETG